jgi:hypothetical protein
MWKFSFLGAKNVKKGHLLNKKNAGQGANDLFRMDALE